MQIDLSDKKLYDLIQRSDNPIIKGTPKPIQEEIVKKKEEPVIITKPEAPKPDLIKKIVIIVFCILIIYFTIFRYVLGYKFFSNKEFGKGTAVLSPELITISSLLLL